MLILASASARRLELLKRIGINPDKIIPADIDETNHKGELPHLYSQRIAFEKGQLISNQYPHDFVLSADTVVSVGRRILPKAETAETARECLMLLSGRNHVVTTSIALFNKGKVGKKSVSTKLKFKKLSNLEIENYINSNEWQGKAGGYGIQGFAGSFCINLQGSWEGVMGLPLYETKCLLDGAGYK